MTKVVPVKMSDDLYARLQQVAEKVGEADSTIIRLVLRAGLLEIVKDNYQLFKFSFEAARRSAVDAGAPSTVPTRYSANEAAPAPRFSEKPPKASPEKPRKPRTGSKP